MTNITKAAQDALKPCPFCGSSAAQYPDGDMEGHSIMCSGDRLEIGASCPMTAFGYATEAEAAERWNLRAALQDKAGEVPDGFALVPVEPTEAMIQAGIDEMPHFTDEPGPVWSAMIAASQQKDQG